METLAGMVRGEVIQNESVKIYLTPPKDINFIRQKKLYFVNTGVPHAVLYTSCLKKTDVEKLGRKIRYDKIFRPHGANVNFVEVSGKNKISVRTYERGVEKETLACGTGVTASGIISVLFRGLKSPILAKTQSGDILKIDTSRVSLTGPAKVVFEGWVTL